MMKKYKSVIAFIVLFSFFDLMGQILVPVEEQIPIILKSLNYEKKLKEKVANAEEVSIGIVFNAADELSVRLKEEMLKAFKNNKKAKIWGKKFHVEEIAYENPMQLEKQIIVRNVHVLLVSIGLDNALSEIRDVARSNTLITGSMRRDDIVNGTAVLGVAPDVNGPRPFVNYVQAKEFLLEFDIQFLNVAEMISN